MTLTTHEKIRTESGFQNRYLKEEFITSPEDGVSGATMFHVRSDDNIKFVPEFGLGGTIAGVSDVKVWIGLSGINEVSRAVVSAIDLDSGAVTIGGVLPSYTGCSLTITYSSSPVTSNDIESVRLQAESIINQRLSLCYDLPISPTPSVLISLANRLSAAFLLIRGYGTGSRDTATDGYALYEQLMGSGEKQQEYGEMRSAVDVGEIGMICSTDYQLVDDSGVVIGRNDEYKIGGNFTFKAGGRVAGRLFDITEENFRYKDWQDNVDRDQPGSGDESIPPIQN